MTTTAWTIVWALLGSLALTSIAVGGALLIAHKFTRGRMIAGLHVLEVITGLIEILGAFADC